MTITRNRINLKDNEHIQGTTMKETEQVIECNDKDKFRYPRRDGAIVYHVLVFVFALYGLFHGTLNMLFLSSSSSLEGIKETTSVISSLEGIKQTTSVIPSKGRSCTPSELNSMVQNSHSYSDCPNTREILKKLVAYNPQIHSIQEKRRPPVIVQVGCNKGDDFISAMRIWTKNSSYSIQGLYTWLQNKKYSDFACHQDEEISIESIPDSTFQLPVKGYCIEPMESTIQMLQKAFTDLHLYDKYTTPQIQLIHAAISNFQGPAKFPKELAGVENLGLHDATTGKFETTFVNVTTLDAFVKQEQISKIDYLSIDTEGHDMQVILGGLHLIMTHSVRYVEFEYHKVGRWATSSLQDLVELLDSFGYDCFWTMNTGELVRLTGCWSDTYHEKKHSNIACVSRKEDKTLQYMDSLSSLGSR